MNSSNTDQKPEINYPCQWQYKLIGPQSEGLKQAVSEIINEYPHSLTPSKSSSSGKYVSYNLEVFVASQEVRDYYFKKLRSHSAIKIVL